MPSIKLYDPSNTPYSINISHNQKAIYIHRDKSINFELNKLAMKNLSADAYLLYMYLIIRYKNRVWALSSQDVFNQTALKKRTYTKALAELIEKKYLMPAPIEGVPPAIKTYHFYEVPKEWVWA